MQVNPLLRTEKDDAQYRLIQIHIRNIQILNETQLQFVQSLPHERKNELLRIYNECIRLFNEVMMTTEEYK